MAKKVHKDKVKVEIEEVEIEETKIDFQYGEKEGDGFTICDYRYETTNGTTDGICSGMTYNSILTLHGKLSELKLTKKAEVYSKQKGKKVESDIVTGAPLVTTDDGKRIAIFFGEDRFEEFKGHIPEGIIPYIVTRDGNVQILEEIPLKEERRFTDAVAVPTEKGTFLFPSPFNVSRDVVKNSLPIMPTLFDGIASHYKNLTPEEKSVITLDGLIDAYVGKAEGRLIRDAKRIVSSGSYSAEEKVGFNFDNSTQLLVVIAVAKRFYERHPEVFAPNYKRPNGYDAVVDVPVGKLAEEIFKSGNTAKNRKKVAAAIEELSEKNHSVELWDERRKRNHIELNFKLWTATREMSDRNAIIYDIRPRSIFYAFRGYVRIPSTFFEIVKRWNTKNREGIIVNLLLYIFSQFTYKTKPYITPEELHETIYSSYKKNLSAEDRNRIKKEVVKFLTEEKVIVKEVLNDEDEGTFHVFVRGEIFGKKKTSSAEVVVAK